MRKCFHMIHVFHMNLNNVIFLKNKKWRSTPKPNHQWGVSRLYEKRKTWDSLSYELANNSSKPEIDTNFHKSVSFTCMFIAILFLFLWILPFFWRVSCLGSWSILFTSCQVYSFVLILHHFYLYNKQGSSTLIHLSGIPYSLWALA